MLKKLLMGLGMAAVTVGSFLYMDYREDRKNLAENIAQHLNEDMVNQALAVACNNRVCDISEQTREETLRHMRKVIDGKVGYELSQAKEQVSKQIADTVTEKMADLDQRSMLDDIMRDVKRQVRSRAMSAVDRGVNDLLKDLRERTVTFTRF